MYGCDITYKHNHKAYHPHTPYTYTIISCTHSLPIFVAFELRSHMHTADMVSTRRQDIQFCTTHFSNTILANLMCWHGCRVKYWRIQNNTYIQLKLVYRPYYRNMNKRLLVIVSWKGYPISSLKVFCFVHSLYEKHDQNYLKASGYKYRISEFCIGICIMFIYTNVFIQLKIKINLKLYKTAQIEKNVCKVA